MTRRPWLVGLTLALAAAVAVAGLALARRGAEEPAQLPPPAAPNLALVIVETDRGPLAAVVGTAVGDRGGALVIPTELSITIPGQGEGTVEESLGLPQRQAATAVANLLGLWVGHHASVGRPRLAAVVDRVGGIEVGGSHRSGEEVLGFLEDAGPGRAAAFELVLEGLLAAAPGWEGGDFAEVDSAAEVAEALSSAAGADVRVLPSAEVATGIFRAEPEEIRVALVDAFGGPDREVVPVIVLNGSGVPGVGELVAERIVGGGFRLVVNENASTFDHEETLVAVGSADDVALGQRVRDLLGVGSVSVSVASGIAPVTIVVGKDLTG